MRLKPDQASKPAKKSRLHPRSKHHGRYNLDALVASSPALEAFVRPNPYGEPSVDFADHKAVRALNTALLKHFYGIEHWEIPANYLCPPIPGRADYLHHAADLLVASNYGKVPEGPNVTALDIGVGANCIYPLIGHAEYGWNFVGADVDATALESATSIVAANALTNHIVLRQQPNAAHLLEGIVQPEDRFDLVLCNPPFHASAEEAASANKRKTSNLNHKKVRKPKLNFGGQSNELWCEGGEKRFVLDLIKESKPFGQQCFWFSSLVSKERNLKAVRAALQEQQVKQVKTLPMGQGNKSSRIIAWTFLNAEQRTEWAATQWTTNKP